MGVAATFFTYARDPRSESFNDGWKFMLADSAHYKDSSYDDSHWRSLSLPHDWAIEGDFSESNPSGTGGGALPGGVGWYRKTFSLNDIQKRNNLMIDFDGAYMNSTVYINGHKLGTRPYGYAPFSYDLTPWLDRDDDNVIAVRVDNAEQPNSRWYSGCGIYRNVWLRSHGDIHIPLWGQHVVTAVTDSLATIDINTQLVSHTRDTRKVQVYSALLGSGKILTKTEPLAVTLTRKKPEVTLNSTLDIDNPHLWSTDDPYLYKIVTFVQDAKTGQMIDFYEINTGLRYFNFDAKKGFSLNGRPMKINGVCMHHDLGALGAAVNTRALERQLEILKEMGANAYRASHNPPAPEVLDLCDRMGILVMDESFDMWRKKKTSHDYSRYFDQWHERDLSDLIRRDRNHPSVIINSIGNEVLEQWNDASADTLSLEEANLILNFGHGKDKLAAAGDEMSVNSMLTRKLADMTRSRD
ncbi:MAG: beta galactosidase jelly roll domain-containing protein, partial [Duncaniella sp.]